MEEVMSWCGAGVMVNVVHSSSGEDTTECLWGDILNRRVSEKSCTRGIGNISWNRQDSDHMKYTSPNYSGNLWVHVSVSAWTFRAIYIGTREVFLYSNCDIYDTQTTTNPIRYIAPILLFVSENWRPSWILHFEAWGASKLQFTHQKLAQHPINM